MPKTIVELFHNTTQQFPERTAMKYKVDGNYTDISYSDFEKNVMNFGAGLKELGLKFNDKIALLCETRPGWYYTDMASLHLGAVTVPIYSTLTPKQVEFILNDSECKMIVISQPEYLETIKKVFNNLQHLDFVITMFDFENNLDFKHLMFDEVIEMGKKSLKESPDILSNGMAALKKDDLVTIIYTSGTTGNPKGVMLSHNNLVEDIKMSLEVLKVDETDVWLSFLPLSHSLERLGGYYAPVYCGATIAIAESIATVGDDMRAVNPTVMTSVPRLFEKMYSMIHENVSKSSLVKRIIFKWAVEVGKRYFYKNREGNVSGFLIKQYDIANKLVFSKLQERTGGRIRFFVSGGAPLPAPIGEFFACAGIPLLEGYGLTETSPVITLNSVDDYRFGYAGKPIPGVEIKTEADGEICTRGPHVMLGYYKDEEATKEMIDEEGWLHTGDIGYIDADNFLKITDRKKNILVTSAGKNIAPQPIENLMTASRFIDQIMMLGDKKPYLIAIVAPSIEHLEYYYQLKKRDFSSVKEMLASELTYDLIMNEIDRLSVDIARYEKIKKVIVVKEFTIENGEITPTMKIKRKVVLEKYAKEIAKTYS